MTVDSSEQEGKKGGRGERGDQGEDGLKRRRKKAKKKMKKERGSVRQRPEKMQRKDTNTEYEKRPRIDSQPRAIEDRFDFKW